MRGVSREFPMARQNRKMPQTPFRCWSISRLPVGCPCARPPWDAAEPTEDRKGHVAEETNMKIADRSISWARVLAAGLAWVLLALPGLVDAASGFALHSPDVAEGKTLTNAQVYSGYGCTGGNESPALTWTDPPAG